MAKIKVIDSKVICSDLHFSVARNCHFYHCQYMKSLWPLCRIDQLPSYIRDIIWLCINEIFVVNFLNVTWSWKAITCTFDLVHTGNSSTPLPLSELQNCSFLGFFFLTNQRAADPHLIKIVYSWCRKNCARLRYYIVAFLHCCLIILISKNS